MKLFPSVILIFWMYCLDAAVPPVTPSWANAAPVIDPDFADRYFVEATVGSVVLRFYYIESSLTTLNNNPYPMGCIYGEDGSKFQELNNPSLSHLLPGQTYKGAYAVSFTGNYWMADREVSQELWQEVMGSKPADWPIDPVSEGWCNYLWDQTSENPVVFVDVTAVRDFITSIKVAAPFVGVDIDLPTEAEWEFACRAIDVPASTDEWPRMQETFGARITTIESNKDMPGDNKVHQDAEIADEFGLKTKHVESVKPWLVGKKIPKSFWDVTYDPALSGVETYSEYTIKLPALALDWRFLLDESDDSAYKALRPGDYNTDSADEYRMDDFIITKSDKKVGGFWQAEMALSYLRTEREVDLGNAWGLKHMHGNVAEWVKDRWDGQSPYKTQSPLASHPDDNQKAGKVGSPADGHYANTTGSKQVVRGGSWFDGMPSCRATSRAAVNPVAKTDKIGFRLIVRE